MKKAMKNVEKGDQVSQEEINRALKVLAELGPSLRENVENSSVRVSVLLVAAEKAEIGLPDLARSIIYHEIKGAMRRMRISHIKQQVDDLYEELTKEE